MELPKSELTSGEDDIVKLLERALCSGALSVSVFDRYPHFFEGTVDSKVDINALKEGFFQEVHLAFRLGPWVIIQEGASCHSSDETVQALAKHCLLCQF
jgi:hypothetical protein